jgi:hypothetical protein
MAALLAVSISAFAESGNRKPDNAAAPSNVTQQNNCSPSASDASSQDEQKTSEQQQIEQQDKDWLHDLQGTYGG